MKRVHATVKERAKYTLTHTLCVRLGKLRRDGKRLVALAPSVAQKDANLAFDAAIAAVERLDFAARRTELDASAAGLAAVDDARRPATQLSRDRARFRGRKNSTRHHQRDRAQALSEARAALRGFAQAVKTNDEDGDAAAPPNLP